jgi:hypothetical protein
MEDMWDIKRVLESQGNTHNKVDVQSNSESKSLILNPSRSPGSPYLQIDLHDTHEIEFGHSICARKEEEIKFPMELVPGQTKIRFNQNCRNNFNIQSPTHPGHIRHPLKAFLDSLDR